MNSDGKKTHAIQLKLTVAGHDKKPVPKEKPEENSTRGSKAIVESSAFEEKNYPAEREQAEVQQIHESNKDREANRELRFKYARWVFLYLVGYSVFVLFLLLMSGFGWWGFVLPELVLGLLVGSTAVSAIGLVHAVTRGLFSKQL